MSAYPVEIRGELAAAPEAIRSTPSPLTFLFLRTGDDLPQEILVEGGAAVSAEALQVGDHVRCRCAQDRGLWRCGYVERVSPVAAEAPA